MVRFFLGGYSEVMSAIDLRGLGLTQTQTAELLGMTQSRVATAVHAEPGTSPNRRTLELLVAVWPELDDAARERVRGRLVDMRRRPA